MAIRFHPLPLAVFPEEARPHIARLNSELRDLFGLEGTIRSPLSSNRSDKSIAQRGFVQVDASRISPSITQVISGMSVSIGTPNLTFGVTNTVGTTNTALSVDSTLAIFDTTAPTGTSTATAVGTAAFAARRDHIHSHLVESRLLSHDEVLVSGQYIVAPTEFIIPQDLGLTLSNDTELRVF